MPEDLVPAGPTREILPFPEDGPGSLSHWRSKIDQAREAIKQTRSKYGWNTHVERYVGKDLTSVPERDAILLPKDYAYAEQKKPLLFYQLPDVVLTPSRPDVTGETAQLFQSVLNELTGPDQLNCKPTVDEVLSDLLVPAGIGLVKIGYEAFTDPLQPTVPMQIGEQPVTDPATGIAIMDPMTGQPMLQPIMADVPNILRERYFCERVSPLDFLYDTSFRGSDWGKCSWMGVRFRIPELVAQSLYGVDPARLRSAAIQGQQPGPDESLAPDRVVQQFGGVEVIEVWYRAIDVDPSVGDPDRIRTFILLDGANDPVVHEDSPYQQLQNGKVMAGLRRIPIYPLTMYYVSDAPIPPSDCAQSRVIVDELSKGRTQMLQQRDRNIPMRGIDISKFSPDSRQKLLEAGIQELIPFDGIGPGDNPLFGLPQSAFPQENFNFNNYAERDLQECWALSGPNLGTTNISGRTATELAMTQQGTETRMEAARVKVMGWWVSVVQGLAALVQQYADEDQFVPVLGQDGSQKLMAWNKEAIAGTFAFSIRPDSAKRIDQTGERKFRLDVWQLLRNDPLVNQQELDRWMMPALGMDPNKMLMQPQPPQPEPPRLTLTLSGEDLSPLSPQYQNVAKVLASRGIQLEQPQPVPQAAGAGGAGGPASGGTPPAPPHGGAVQGLSPINKHQQEQTGLLPGPTPVTRPV